MLISFSLDTCSLEDAGSIRKLVVVCRSLVRNHLLILNDFWLLLYTNCGAKSVYNRATLPLVTSSTPILSQLFVLVWWSSTESSVTQQTIFLCFAFSLLFISSSASINWDGFCTRTQWWQRNSIKEHNSSEFEVCIMVVQQKKTHWKTFTIGLIQWQCVAYICSALLYVSGYLPLDGSSAAWNAPLQHTITLLSPRWGPVSVIMSLTFPTLHKVLTYLCVFFFFPPPGRL